MKEQTLAGNPMVRSRHLLADLGRFFLHSGYTTEWQGATLMLGLGTWLVIGQMFSTCPSVYWVMSSMASEPVWGALFLAVATVQIYALFFGSRSLRRAVLLFNGGLWTTLTITLLYGDWHTPGVPIYAILALSAFRAFLVHGRLNAV
jgi:hypothetical protein